MGSKILNCADHLIFRDYYTAGKINLHAGHFCQVPLLCQFCAIRRGSKAVQSYLPKFEQIRQDHPEWRPLFITLTVRNGEDLGERMNHLKKAWGRAIERRRDVLRGQRGSTPWARCEAAVGAYEVTKKGRGWHPHIHMVSFWSGVDWYSDLWLEIKREWQELTGDSFMVDVRPFPRADQEPGQGFVEVFKYALKLGSMDHADTWQAYVELQGRRMIFSLGAFRGVKIPDGIEDEPLEGLPFIEIWARYLGGAQGYTIERASRAEQVA